MLTELNNWLKEVKKAKNQLLIKSLNFRLKDYEKLVIDVQIKDLDVIIKKINTILERRKINELY